MKTVFVPIRITYAFRKKKTLFIYYFSLQILLQDKESICRGGAFKNACIPYWGCYRKKKTRKNKKLN